MYLIARFISRSYAFIMMMFVHPSFLFRPSIPTRVKRNSRHNYRATLRPSGATL